MRKTSSISSGDYKIYISQFLFEDFLVALGHVTRLISPVIEGISRVDLLDLQVEVLFSKVLAKINPAELPDIFKALTKGVVAMGPDPLDGGKPCADLSSASLNEIFGEDPSIVIAIIKEVAKVNSGFLKTAFPKWEGILSSLKTSQTTLAV